MVDVGVVIIVIAIVIAILAIIFILWYFASRSTPCSSPGALRDFSGNCFTCPKGMSRQLAEPINGAKACSGGCEDVFRDDPKAREGLPFEDFLSGMCYSCGRGRNRTWAAITAPNACIGACSNIFNTVPNVEQDLDGSCYTCPDGTHRSWASVHSSNACVTDLFDFEGRRATIHGNAIAPSVALGPKYSSASYVV